MENGGGCVDRACEVRVGLGLGMEDKGIRNDMLDVVQHVGLNIDEAPVVRATRSTTNSSTRTRRGPQESGKLVLISTTKHKGTS